MPLRSSKIHVAAVPLLPIYRATYKNHSAYGRTPEQAVDRLKLQYKNRRTVVGDIGDAVGYVLLSPFLQLRKTVFDERREIYRLAGLQRPLRSPAGSRVGRFVPH